MFDVRVRGNGDGQISLAAQRNVFSLRMFQMPNPNERSGMRAIFAPATAHSDAVKRPNCSECGTATVLVGIEPDRPGCELRTFQCPNCENFEIAVGKAAPPGK